MKILALDPATKCGWARFDSESSHPILSGAINLGKGKGNGFIFSEFDTFILCNLNGVQLVYCEAPFINMQKSKQANVQLAYGLRAILIMRCWKKGIEPVFLAPMSLKKLATGTGKATKEDMVAAAEEFSGKEMEDDNEGDAVCLLKVAMESVGATWIP